MSGLLQNRIVAGALLGVTLLFAGGVAGLFYGGAVLPKGQGLAGPAIVLGWGVAFGAVAALIGIVLAATLPLSRLKTVAQIAAVAGALAVTAIVGRIIWVQASKVTEAEQTSPATPRPVPVPTAPADRP